jgi:hypothetical protein
LGNEIRRGPQIQAKIVPMVQVILDYMGIEKQMCVRKNTHKSEFLSQAKALLGTTHNLDATPLGLDAWEIRAGFTYDVRETRKLSLKCKDTMNREFTISIAGTKEIEDVQEACRRHWGLEPWLKITIVRQDGAKFFLQDGSQYLVAIQYDPNLDPRPLVTLRVDLSDRTYLIPDFRLEDDPAKVLKLLSSKHGFPSTKTTQVRFTPDRPWTTGQTVCITFKVAISCVKVTLEEYSRREFTLHIADDPWESGEVLLPTAFGKDQIWEHLQRMH